MAYKKEPKPMPRKTRRRNRADNVTVFEARCEGEVTEHTEHEYKETPITADRVI